MKFESLKRSMRWVWEVEVAYEILNLHLRNLVDIGMEANIVVQIYLAPFAL